jgi:hypothetical protein
MGCNGGSKEGTMATLMKAMAETLSAKAYDPGMVAQINRLWPLAKSGGWADVAFQNAREEASFGDKTAAVHLMGCYEDNNLAAFTVQTGGKPGPDADRDGNAEKLEYVPEPFTAAVRQVETFIGTADGYIEWNEPITASTVNGPVTLNPGGVSLEIGYMPSGKIWGHVVTGHFGGLARWPYGSDRIFVMIPRSRPDLWQQD